VFTLDNMIKKRIFAIFFLFLILISFSLLQAQENSTEKAKVEKAYDCLKEKVEGNCDSLTTEEKIFSLMAIDECEEELIGDSSSEECWPFGNCNLKTTAQAALVLNNAGKDVDKAQQWILSQKKATSELVWYLQIESNTETTCTISYEGFSNNIKIKEDKKISGDAGPCLSLVRDDYWLQISPLCYEKEFSISCDKDFSTTLLFQKQGSPTIHIFQKTSSSAEGGTLTEKVESFCFRGGSTGSSCNYEASLWATLFLNSLEEDVTFYLPYLITLAEDNEKFLPEAFLYLITDDTEYSTSLLSKQKKIGEYLYWQESSDKHYDTALALFPFKYEDLAEKTSSKQWLLETQDAKGCWLDNIRNTAFILASVWPKEITEGGDGGILDCLSEGYYCVNKGSCEGQVLSDYYCSALLTECCTIAPEQQTCAERGGVVCTSDQICNGGSFVSAADTDNCCIDGFCQAPSSPEISECEREGGICRTSCFSDEEEVFYECGLESDVCCTPQAIKKKSNIWLWIFLILIVLVVIGIIFKDKLRNFWFKAKSKFKKSKPGPKPGTRPGPPASPFRAPPYARGPVRERRILPSFRHPPARTKRAPSKSQKEIDEILKKLKDLGK